MIFYNSFFYLAMAQQGMVYGEVQDGSTLKSIPFAHVATSSSGTVTNMSGRFRLPGHKADTIRFSHINYEPFQMIIGGQDTLLVLLYPRDILLDEITIGRIPSEDKFKKLVLEMRVPQTRPEKNATGNVLNAKKLVLAGFGPPTVSSPDSYKVYVQGPEGVSIFSSNPSKGLFKALRDIRKELPVFRPHREMPDLPDFRLKKQNLPDTTTLSPQEKE